MNLEKELAQCREQLQSYEDLLELGPKPEKEEKSLKRKRGTSDKSEREFEAIKGILLFDKSSKGSQSKKRKKVRFLSLARSK